jgi:alkylation response protein AidB-like acyl-CoA dehydrogenase
MAGLADQLSPWQSCYRTTQLFVDVARPRDRLYHDLLSPAETEAIRERVRQFARNTVAPRASEIGQREESRESFPRDVFAAMARAELFGLPFGTNVGGQGLRHPVCATAAAIEELAYCSSSVAAIYDVHCILAGHALEHADPDLRARYLRPLIEGTNVGCFATTEPYASTDLSPRALETTAVRRDDDYLVNGHKRFISPRDLRTRHHRLTVTTRSGRDACEHVFACRSKAIPTAGSPRRSAAATSPGCARRPRSSVIR